VDHVGPNQFAAAVLKYINNTFHEYRLCGEAYLLIEDELVELILGVIFCLRVRRLRAPIGSRPKSSEISASLEQ